MKEKYGCVRRPNTVHPSFLLVFTSFVFHIKEKRTRIIQMMNKNKGMKPLNGVDSIILHHISPSYYGQHTVFLFLYVLCGLASNICAKYGKNNRHLFSFTLLGLPYE